MTFLRQITAFRYLVYAVILPLMLIEHIGIALRTGWDLWCALVSQHEAGFRRPKTGIPQMTPAMQEATFEMWGRAVEVMDRLEATAGQAKPLPASTGKTIKFRRYTVPRGPFAATCDTQ